MRYAAIVETIRLRECSKLGFYNPVSGESGGKKQSEYTTASRYSQEKEKERDKEKDRETENKLENFLELDNWRNLLI